MRLPTHDRPQEAERCYPAGRWLRPPFRIPKWATASDAFSR
jgi:hypothetical protein